MAGTEFKISHSSDELLQALNQVLTRADDASPAMAEISEYLHLQTRDRFDSETAPDGSPWAPLQPATLEAKAKAGVPIARILHGKSLLLRDTIFPFHSADEAGVSTAPATSAYAATHQFGDAGRNIDARPFLGIGPEDEDALIGILSDFLAQGYDGSG